MQAGRFFMFLLLGHEEDFPMMKMMMMMIMVVMETDVADKLAGVSNATTSLSIFLLDFHILSTKETVQSISSISHATYGHPGRTHWQWEITCQTTSW